MIWNTPFWELQNLGTTRLFTSQGIFGGYPGSTAYIHNIRANDLRGWPRPARPTRSPTVPSTSRR